MRTAPIGMARLAGLLEQELEELEALRALGEQEYEAIRTLKTQGLLAIGSERLKRLNALCQLEQERMALVRDLAGELTLSPETLTVEHLLSRLKPCEADRLRDWQHRLGQALNAVRAHLARNRALVSQFLTFLKEALAKSQAIPPSVPLYAPSGKLHARSDRAVLLEQRG